MKKRFISFFLVLFVLIPLIPKPADSKILVKNIDVIYDDFKLQVEGKNISSKEVFVYEGDLWVPLKDLGEALGLQVDFDPSSGLLKLNSNGRLNVDDSSKANIAYQRGYEIQAKERIIREINKEIREFEGRSLTKDSDSQAISKNISVGFSNTSVYLDEKKLDLNREPLLYNEDLYLALVDLSPLLYITPSLEGNIVSIDSNAVLVEKDGYSSVDALASFRDSLNDRLDIQLEQMEKRKAIIMDVKIPYEKIDSLSDMETYLNKYLDKIVDIPVNIALRSGSDSWYSLDIEFPRRYDSEWKDLSRRDVEAYIWDIYVAISSLYDEDARIQGAIKNPNYSSSSKHSNYVEFDTRIKDLIFSFINSDLDMSEKVDPVFIEEILRERLGRYRGKRFDYSARISGYDLDLIVRLDSRDYIEKWYPEEKLELLKKIAYEIELYHPSLRVNGRVQYPGEDDIDFLIDEGRIRSQYIVDEMIEDINDRYGTFNLNGRKIPMKYGFYEVDIDNYKLIVDMDFDQSASKWDQADEDALGSFLQDIIKEIVSLWDVNIFTQVYDKNSSLVTEFLVSQDTVQAVTADPSPGQIEEGKAVSLTSNTPDAEIYYTIDGTNPSENNRILYTGPIVINKATTIKAYAVKDGYKDSPLYEFVYSVLASDDIASGLDSLTVDSGDLVPNFDRYEYNYSLDLPSSVESIRITARATKGSISINGLDAPSGQAKEIALSSDQSKIEIRHKEEGKSDRVYSILVNREEEEASDVRLDSDYIFQTSVVGIFEGQLRASINDFSDYTIKLFSGDSQSIKPYDQVKANRDGSFRISLFPIDFWDKHLGYRYEVLDKNDFKVDEGNLRVQK